MTSTRLCDRSCTASRARRPGTSGINSCCSLDSRFRRLVSAGGCEMARANLILRFTAEALLTRKSTQLRASTTRGDGASSPISVDLFRSRVVSRGRNSRWMPGAMGWSAAALKPEIYGPHGPDRSKRDSRLDAVSSYGSNPSLQHSNNDWLSCVSRECGGA